MARRSFNFEKKVRERDLQLQKNQHELQVASGSVSDALYSALNKSEEPWLCR